MLTSSVVLNLLQSTFCIRAKCDRLMEVFGDYLVIADITYHP
jgi:hypothetical protein